jgi:hypothetical protein
LAIEAEDVAQGISSRVLLAARRDPTAAESYEQDDAQEIEALD